jgi:hypothetical protein
MLYRKTGIALGLAGAVTLGAVTPSMASVPTVVAAVKTAPSGNTMDVHWYGRYGGGWYYGSPYYYGGYGYPYGYGYYGGYGYPYGNGYYGGPYAYGGYYGRPYYGWGWRHRHWGYW